MIINNTYESIEQLTWNDLSWIWLKSLEEAKLMELSRRIQAVGLISLVESSRGESGVRQRDLVRALKLL